MRRTTICRFDRAALLALVAVPLACWSLRAQDTTQAAAPPAPSTQPLQGELPATHTVVRGETLWSLAQLYFNDPLLWPEIYRLNTSLIEDPHWIYPGEVLQVAGGVNVAQAPADTTVRAIAQGAPDTAVAAPADTVAAAPAPADTVAATPDTVAAAPVDTLLGDTTQALVEEPPPPPVEEAYQTIFDRPRSRTAEVERVLSAYSNQPYRPVRRGEFYSAGFLTEGEHLPWGRVVGTTDKPAIPRLTERATAIPFSRVIVEPPPHASYHVGDSLLIARTDREEGDWGDVVVPLAVARVVEVAKTQLLAEIVTQFGRVHDGHLTLPLEPFKDPGEARPTTVYSGLTGRVISVRDLHTMANAQQILFLDRGRIDGVVPGDVFQVYTGQAGTPSEELRAVVEIVHTREHSSSGLILTIKNPQLPPGLPVRLIRKMPS
jgi:LysM repeat protein